MTAQTVTQAYRFALDPSPAMQRALRSHVGAARFAFNQMLALVKTQMDQRDEERASGIVVENLTPSAGWSLYALRKEWNLRKHGVAPWWPNNSKEAYNSGLFALSQALKNWDDSRKGKRAGKPMEFPKFKKRGDRLGVRFTTGTIRVEADRHHEVMPRLGRIHTLESTRKLARRVEADSARVLAATVTRDGGGRWFCSFTVEVQRRIGRSAVPSHTRAGLYPVVGIDLGVKDLIVAATADGKEVMRVAAPRSLGKAQARLRRLQRKATRQRGPWLADPSAHKGGHRRQPSKRWQSTQHHIAKTHRRASTIRLDTLHKTTTKLAHMADVVVVEDLNVAGMSRRKPGAGAGGRGLNRAIADAGLATVKRLLGYKTNWYGSELTVIDRWYPSSKTCSGCGTVKTKLSLAERTFECDHCHLRVDRDLNAAINIARTGERMLRECVSAGSAPVAGRRATRKTKAAQAAGAGGYEASTPRHPMVDQTGSATSQGEAA